MDIFNQIAEKIIREQETIIGPLALEQAKNVPGIVLDQKQHVDLTGDKKKTVEKLIETYQNLFGNTSLEVCRSAVKDLVSKLPKDQVPALLLN